MIVSLCCFRNVFSCSSDWVCCLYGRCERQSAGSMPPLMCLHDLCKHSEDRSWTLSRLPTKHHWRYTRVSSLEGIQTGIHSTDAAHLDLCTRCQRSELSSADRLFQSWKADAAIILCTFMARWGNFNLRSFITLLWRLSTWASTINIIHTFKLPCRQQACYVLRR